jgi:hypothetical protein
LEQRFFEQATPGKGFVKPERAAAIDPDYKFQGSKPDVVGRQTSGYRQKSR